MADRGVPVIGICGGYQMIGEKVCDPLHVESENDEVEGLGLLPTITTMQGEKIPIRWNANAEICRFLE